jgi:predicted Zn-dependent peptidase
MRSLMIVLLLASAALLAAESIDRVVLPTGLTVVTAELHTSRAVEIRVIVKAGANFEQEQVGSGLSALTQRLIVSGATSTHSAGQMRDLLAKLGDQTATSLTAGTSTFALTTTADNLSTALQYMASRVTAPVFTREDVERERALMAATPIAADQEALLALLYRQHPARLPMNGIKELRDYLTVEQLQSYHKRRYRTANTVVMVCGNVHSLVARRLVEQAFNSYPVGGFAGQLATIEPPPLAARYQVVTSAALHQPRVVIAWRTEQIDHASQPSLAVLTALLSGEQGVITQTLRLKGLGEDIRIENVTPVSAPGYIRLSFTTTNERRAEAEQVVYKTLERLVQEPLDEEVVTAARASAIQQLVTQASTIRGLTDQLSQWEIAAGDPAYGRRFIEQTQEVDAAEMIRVLRRYVLSREGDRGRCTVVVRPLDTVNQIPTNEQLKVPNPSSIVMPEMVELTHGIRLLTRPTFEQSMVTVGLVLGGAAAVEDSFRHGATALLAQAMCRATDTRSAKDIETLLSRSGMRLVTSGTAHRLSIMLTCFPKDVSSALELLVDCFAHASLPVEEVELVRQRATSENALCGWEPRFHSEIANVVLDDHYGALDPRCLKRGFSHIDRSVLFSHYRRLTVGGNAVFTAYGSFDRTVVVEKITALIKACPEIKKGQPIKPEGTPWGERQPSLTVTSHDAAQMALALVWHGPTLADRERDEAAMEVLSALLNTRLQRIAGLISGTSLAVHASSFDKRGLWWVSGACDVGQTDAVQQAVRDEIARFIAQLWLPEADRGALLEAELVAARAATEIRWALAQEEVSEVATTHAMTLLLGQDVALDINHPQRLAGIGRKDLLRVAQAWLTGEPISVLAKPKVIAAVPPLTLTVPVHATTTSPPAPLSPNPAPNVSPVAQPPAIPVVPVSPQINPAKP